MVAELDDMAPSWFVKIDLIVVFSLPDELCLQLI